MNFFRCSKCILPSTYRYADFDRNHVCKYCRNFIPKHFGGTVKLKQDVNLQDNEKLGVLVSGGKDSVYMWGRLTEIYGSERITAINWYKRGLTHPLAYTNIQQAQKILKTELIISEDNLSCDRFKTNLRILLDNPSPAIVRVALCAGCRYGITENLYKIGKSRGIRKFFSGASYLELAPFKEELLCTAMKMHDNSFEKMLQEEYPKLDYANNLSIILRDHQYKYKDNNTLKNNLRTSNYPFIPYDFDDYYPNEPSKIEAYVTKYLEWKRPECGWHFDCIIEEFKNLFYLGLLGYTELDFKLSAMIRYGLITRQQGIQEIQTSISNIQNSFEDMNHLLEQLEMSDCLNPLKKFYNNSMFL